MQIFTVVMVGLVLLPLVLGVTGLRSSGSKLSALAGRDQARRLLDRTELDMQQGLAYVTLAAQVDRPPEAIGLLGEAVSFQQSAIEDWGNFELASRSWGAGGPHAAAIDTDLGQMAGVTGAALGSQGTPHARLLPAGALAADARHGIQVGSYLSQLTRDDQTWWAQAIASSRDSGAAYSSWLDITGVVALLALFVGYSMFARSVRRRETHLETREQEISTVGAVNEFEARLQRALDLSTTERRVFDVVEQALGEAAPGVHVEVLLADSSRAHLQRLVENGDVPARRCSVESPVQCPAAQRGEVLTFASSRALDACPFLKEQSEECSALCVPVSVAGTTVGVVHAAGAAQAPPDARTRRGLELVARRSSDRIGMLRAFARSEAQASTDPLTGLSNRRALEDSIRELTVSTTPYAVAFGDLDHFKALNDVHGHGAGDQALRVFSNVLRDSLRPGDLVGRYGGEEFVVALPRCGTKEAVAVLERIRERLAKALGEAGGPSFTVSFGLAPSQPGWSFEQMVQAADVALLEAKAEGRNRIVITDGVRELSAAGT